MMMHKIWMIPALITLALGACGTDSNTSGAGIAKSLISQVVAGRKAPAAPPTPLNRAALSQFKSPMIQADIEASGAFTYLVPVAQNGGVETWSTSDDRTISFRQGVMVATRGFGPDIMQSAAPTISQIASGTGTYARAYYYLDGADQMQRFDYQCKMSFAGTEAITVVDRTHSTRHVIESCTGKTGVFTNEYWFENGVFLRKSKQLLFNEWGHITFQRVIDNG